MADAPGALLLLAGGRQPIPPIVRPPLPPFPPGRYQTTLPWTPPNTRDFLRADSWGVTVPGAPWVPGASSKHPERVLSWFLDRYPGDFQRQYLTAYAGRQYTHIKLSAADSMGPPVCPYFYPGPPGNERTLQQFVATCGLAKQYVPYVQVVLGSKYFQPQNMSPDQWAAYADPIMDALVAAKVVDEFILAWEWNLFNVPGPWTIQAFKHAGHKAHAAGCSFWMHFSTECTSWYADGDPRGRFGFYDDLGADVDGLNYQTDPTWDIPMLQARIVDSLSQFGRQGNVHKFRMDEDSASLMFDGDTPTEDDANLRGYCACCTTDNVAGSDARVWGYGNGGRRPDGSRL